MHAVGEQGRRQGVARETFIGSTVEFETDALSSIDPLYRIRSAEKRLLEELTHEWSENVARCRFPAL